MPELNDEQQLKIYRAYTRWFAIAVTFLVALPTLYGFLIRPANSLYFGLQYNFDDHMVYAAWMKQAAQGHLTFQNLFTADPQPGLTLHLYFLVLGWISKFLGIPLTMFVARLGFTFLSVTLIGRLVEYVTERTYPRKVGLALAVLGGGIGFLVWHNFGVAIVKPENNFLAGPLLSRLPNDVWQPEAFFFPSALTNGLFMVSLSLMLGVLLNILRAQSTKAAILPGAACFGLLMNIHSYDVLLLTLCLVGFIAAFISSKQIKKEWVSRSVLIGLGAIPFALYFVYVLKNDPVFQARAATLTYSPNFRQILAGYSLLLVPAIIGLSSKDKSRQIGLGLFILVMVGMCFAAKDHLGDLYFMSLGVWVGVFGLILISLYFMRPERPGLALVVAWAFVGIVAPYFPALFERKLTMMLSVPWGILAGVGIATILEKRERGERNLLTTLAIVLVCATGARWIGREKMLATDNVSNTTTNSVYYADDIGEIIHRLEPLGSSVVIAALPGIPSPTKDSNGNAVIDSFDSPALPDLNSVMVGMAGTKAYTGHWSETPDYEKKRKNLTDALLAQPPTVKALGINYLVLPKSGLGEGKPIEQYGTVEYQGTQWALIKVQ